MGIHVLLAALLDQTGWDCAEFVEHTELQRNFYYLIKRKSKVTYNKRTVVTLAIAFRLTYLEAELLLRSAGHCLNSQSEIDMAYFQLWESGFCPSVLECNDQLNDLGIDEKYWLGSVPRQFKN